MSDLLSALSNTPLPTILVVAGILFWILAIAGSLAGKVTVEPAKQKTAGLVGSALIVSGLVLFFAGPINPAGEKATAKTTPANAPAPAQTTAAPAPEKKAELPSPVKSDQASARPGPGVNCTGTGTPDEIRICASSKLSELDWQLYGVYQAASKRLDKDHRARLVSEESAWVRQRGECQSDDRCILTAYKSRIDQLQAAQ